MFLAPVLYALHAVLTGLAMALMDVLGVKLGFGFSAGLSRLRAQLHQGDAAAAAAAGRGWPISRSITALFRFAIARFDLKTPGREAEPRRRGDRRRAERARRGVRRGAGRGGAICASIDACTTRLRLVVARSGAGRRGRGCRALGARGRDPALGARRCRSCSARSPMPSRWKCAPRPGRFPPRNQLPSAIAGARRVSRRRAVAGGARRRDNVLEAGAASSRVWLRLAMPRGSTRRR